MSKDWKCDKRGCDKDPEELYCFREFGNNKNKMLKGWYCEECFNKLYEEGEQD